MGSKTPAPAGPQVTAARCTSAATQLGYQIRGCTDIDIIRADRACALYLLSRGCTVVVIDGNREAENHWRPTFAEAETLFWVLRAELRSRDDDS